MLIDCDRCIARGPACTDCVVTVFLAIAPSTRQVELDESESAAVAVLAEAGLVPPLRLVSGISVPFWDTA
jgi:hypothetical protein